MGMVRRSCHAPFLFACGIHPVGGAACSAMRNRQILNLSLCLREQELTSCKARSSQRQSLFEWCVWSSFLILLTSVLARTSAMDLTLLSAIFRFSSPDQYRRPCLWHLQSHRALRLRRRDPQQRGGETLALRLLLLLRQRVRDWTLSRRRRPRLRRAHSRHPCRRPRIVLQQQPERKCGRRPRLPAPLRLPAQPTAFVVPGAAPAHPLPQILWTSRWRQWIFTQSKRFSMRFF